MTLTSSLPLPIGTLLVWQLMVHHVLCPPDLTKRTCLPSIFTLRSHYVLQRNATLSEWTVSQHSACPLGSLKFQGELFYKLISVSGCICSPNDYSPFL